ncbi:MAG: peptidylprolyl isomerase [Bacteroidales bacterium]|nr:peptidylprolyl isomerase [Bacteroidales bacterium]
MKKYFAYLLILPFILVLSQIQVSAQVVGQNDEPVILDRVLAIVGGHPVFQSDVESQYLTARAMGYATQANKCSIFEKLMVSKLLLNQSEIDSIEVDDGEVESEVKNRLQGMLQDAGGSEEMIVEYFKKSMLEIEKDMFKPIKEQMLTQRMQNTITADARITPSEVQKFYRSIPKDEIPLIPETLEIEQIVLKPRISQEEISRVKNKLRDFREQILNGKSMSTLAVLYSQDPGSHSQGGELGFLPRGVLVPEFAKVAYNLKKGDVSRVVKTEFGYHIMQLIARKGDMINVRHILLRPEVSIEAKLKTRSQLDSIANGIRQSDLSFGDAALLYSVDEKSRANGGLMVNEKTASSKFEPKDLEPAIMTTIKKLKTGEISNPFETKDQTDNTVYKIIRIKSKVPAHRADIDQDYQFIQEIALKKKQQDIIDEWIADKQKSMYLRIHDDYKNCKFQYKGWLK